jgi:hypothetical protein
MTPEGTSLQIVDRTGDLWHFFEPASQPALEERLQEFKARILEPNMAYYSNVIGLSDDAIRHYLEAGGPMFRAMQTARESLLSRFAACVQAFCARFPDFRVDFPVILLPSLDLFKGVSASSQGQIFLLLGLDALAGLSDGHYKSYIIHELFHAYHFQRVPAVGQAVELALRTGKMPALWGLLWTEGAACQAVRMVVPGIPQEEVLDWRPLFEQVRPRLPELAAEARRVLRSDAPLDIAGFFYFPRPDSDIPTGCGYILGMLATEGMLKRTPLDELLRLDDEALVGALDQALTDLEG